MRISVPLLLLALALSIAAPAEAQPIERPNFVFIFADDLGYADIGPFGSTVHRTPNLDRMADEGMRFTNFYVTSGVCTPSRASLMTGSYPRRVSLHENGRDQWVLFPANQRGLHPDEITVAEVLKQRGYATGMVGKWHLGDQPEFLPTRQGFDSYYGIPFSNDMGDVNRPAAHPVPLLRGETVIEAPVDQRTITRRYTEEAVSFIQDHQDEPFFLYLAHTMPHNPTHASAPFRGRSINGRYGDTIEEIDWSTGEILAALDDLGLDERTMVIFTSDNGASDRWGGANYPLRGFKGSTMEGGMRVPMIARWPGQVPMGTTQDELASTLDILPTFAHLSGGRVPEDRIIDGENFWPLLAGHIGAVSSDDVFYYYYMGDLEAVRSGRWKLHFLRNDHQTSHLWLRADRRGEELDVRLFDLSTDISENRDVSPNHPEVVSRLRDLAERARHDLGDGEHAGVNQRPPGHVDDTQPLVLEAERNR
ncbi:MAG: sulfatase [Rhodothermales bacterium]